MKNREGDQALQGIAALPIEELVQIISFAGFKGIYLDRFGYADNGAAIETKLSDLLQNKPIVSPNGRLVFFNLVDYVGRLREKYPDNEWEANEDLSFHPVLVDWKGGFSGYESLPGKTWRWCSSEGELHLRNTSQRPRTIRLEMSFATGYEQLDDLVISGLISEQLKVNATPSFFAKTITVPPGESVINFRSSAKRVYAPLDTRFLVFKVEDFKMTELQLKPN
jgi:phosphoglycerol transferase